MFIFWISLFCIGCICSTIAYWIARKVNLMAIVDTIWTVGLGLGAIAYFICSGVDAARSWAVLLVVSIWSFRLSFHLFKDRVFSGREDPRYHALAEYWGRRAKRNFYFLFLVQTPLVLLFLFPVSQAMSNSVGSWALSDSLALLIALVALGGEYLADKQLAAFRSNPEHKNGVCRNGLWQYSRHPNYFFEWLHWLAYVAFAWGSPNVWSALIGSVAMYVFLRFLTGVPYAERSSLKNRGSDYRQYQETTNAFFPWIPRNRSA